MNTNFNQTEIRICQYCGNKYEVKTTSGQLNCSNTCKTYMSQTRTGKRKPLSSIEPSNGDKDTFENELQKFNVQINKKKNEEKELKNKTNEIKYSDFLYVKKEIKEDEKELSDILSTWAVPQNATPEEIQEDLEDKIRGEKRIIALRDIIAKSDRLKGALLKLEKELKTCQLSLFKKIQERNKFYNLNTKNSQGVSGLELERFLEYQTKYPFKQMIGYAFLEDLGTPEQPFVMSIQGERGSGKTILVTSFIRVLLETLEVKCLYAADTRQIKDVANYFKLRNVNSPLLTVFKFDSHNDISQALKKDDYEFLVIDEGRSLNINYQKIQSLQKQYPFLSIIITGDRIPENIKSVSFALVICEKLDIGEVSLANTYIKGKLVQEENENIIFTETNGKFSFGMGFTKKDE